MTEERNKESCFAYGAAGICNICTQRICAEVCTLFKTKAEYKESERKAERRCETLGIPYGVCLTGKNMEE